MATGSPRLRRSWWVALLIGVVWAELSLQLFAFGYRWWATRTRAQPPHAAELTILCLGDSYTVGAGTETDQSYPRQLERLLQAQWPERTIQVINAGVGGVNSSQALHRLPQQIRQARPDLVLLLIGILDGINFQGVDAATLQAVESSWRIHLKTRLDWWLSRVQLYRLVKRLVSPWGDGGGPSRAGSTVSAEGREGPYSRERLLVEIGALLKAEPNAARQLLRDPAGGDVAPWSLDELHDRLLPWVQRALQPAPGDPEPLVRLGRLFHSYGRKKRGAVRRRERSAIAQQLYERALAVATEAQDVLLAHAELYEARREFTRARPVWEQLIEQDPANPTLYVRLGHVQMKQGAGEDAIASARTALTLNPEDPGAHHLLGEVFGEQWHWEQAQTMFRRAVELDASRDGSWRWLAEASKRLGQVEQARQAWREVFRRKPDPLTLAELGQSYQDSGQGREAMRALLNEVRVAAFQDPAYWEPYERLVAHGMSDGLGERLLALNLERIAAYLTTQGIRVGLLTYPGRSMEDRTNRVVRQVAVRHPGILLIDVQDLADRFADPTLGLTSPDGYHLNARGYRLMARHIMETLVAAGTLQAVTPAPGGTRLRPAGSSADE